MLLFVCVLGVVFVTDVTHGWMESPAEEAFPCVGEDSDLDIDGVPVMMRAYGVVGGLRTGNVD